MVNKDKRFPNISWPQFAVCNDNPTVAFEDMTRRLFNLEFLGDGKYPHSDHNNPGVEVLPILEPVNSNGGKQRKVSFQSKYFEGKVLYSKIKESALQAVKHYKGQLDLIYLFCNKTLTTTAQGYIEAERILNDAGIELQPISNSEVLDLVFKYVDIANYFFLSRKHPDDDLLNLFSTGIIVNESAGVSFVGDAVRDNSKCVVDPRLLESLIQEKIELCKTYIKDMEFAELRLELEKIFSYGIDGLQGFDILLFYKVLCDIHDGKSMSDDIDKLAEINKGEANWLLDYYLNPVRISVYNFAKHPFEVQVLVLDKMFSAQLWEALVDISQGLIDAEDSEISDVAKVYYGLSLFNTNDYGRAYEKLNSAYVKNRKESVHLYAVLAEIKHINIKMREGNYEQKERLVELLKVLDQFVDNKHYVANRNLIAILNLESAYSLGMNEKVYLENGIEKYNEYDENVKNDPVVCYLYGLCLELNGNIDDAEKVYSNQPWREDDNITLRYMICKISKGDYESAINIYKEVCNATISEKIKSLYLSALYYKKDESYEKLLSDAIAEQQGKVEGIIDIALGIREKKYISEIVMPVIKNLLTDSFMKNLLPQQKAELISICCIGGELEVLWDILQTIENLNILHRYLGFDVYKLLFDICNDKYINHNPGYSDTREIDIAECIADRFLELDLLRKEFLQIKYLCAGAKEKRFSMLKYAKELFEITRDEEMARNIIGMLFERNENDYSKYAPYITVLVSSEKPEHCIAVASAMLRLGKSDEADLYAYKALYYLNDKDDFNIYRSYFGYYNQSMNRYHEKNVTRVIANTVVTLEECNPVDNDNPCIRELCLDSESEFCNLRNHSLGIEHVSNKDPIYLKMMGSGLRQVIKIGETNYKIIQIRSRMEYAASFIFKKISQYPDKFNGAVLVFSSEKPEDLLCQIRTLTERSEHTESLLRFYHLEENEIGLPIDAFTGGNYERYIDALNMLLYAKDQAFYTGFPIYEDETNQRYVLSLSTLVLLSSMKLLDVLNAVKESIIIPQSYTTFFAERYAEAKKMMDISPGSLVNIGDKMALIKNDGSEVEIWERIIDFCNECQFYDVAEDDRIGFMLGEGLDGEQFLSAAQLHMIHLDAFILAMKENATFLCDDLFFRKIATYAKIRNINFVSLLRHYVDEEFVVPIIMELSKTNYLYIPLLARTDAEAMELRKNILSGERKSRYYKDVLMAYNMALDSIAKDFFEVVPDIEILEDSQ